MLCFDPLWLAKSFLSPQHFLATLPPMVAKFEARRFLLSIKSLINFLKLQVDVLPGFQSKDVLLVNEVQSRISSYEVGLRGGNKTKQNRIKGKDCFFL